MPDTQDLPVALGEALDLLPTGFVLLDAGGGVVAANRPLGAMLAGPGGAAGALDSREAVARAVLDGALTIDGERIGHGEATVTGLHDRIAGLGGGEIAVERTDSGSYILAGRDMPDGGQLLTATDTTDLSAAKAVIEGNQEEFRTIFLEIPLPVRVSRVADWTLIHESRAAAELFGENRPIATGRNTVSSYAEEGERQALVAQLLRDGYLKHYQIDMRRRDGTIFPALLSSRIVTMAGQDVSITSFHDLTDAREAEREIREARETLEDAIESLADGLIVYDEDDRLVICNARYKEFHGESADLLVPGGYWPDITRERGQRGFFVEAGDDFDAWLEDEIGKRDSAKSEEFASVYGRWYEYSHRPTRRGGFVSTWRDITERKRAQEELARQREILHQNEKLSALGQLLAGVSHELNNPLSVVIGQSQLLMEDATDDETLARADKIARAAERCARIVRIFLAMARQKPLATEPMDVNEVLRAALEMMGYSLRSTGIELSVDLAEGLDEVEGDADQIGQVVTNLLINAQHALEEIEGAKRITMATRAAADGGVELTITDNGPGVAPEHRARIFEPFFTTKPDGSGTGVGLTLCHRIIDAHRGSIHLDDRDGPGAAFRIVLPAAEAPVEGDTKAEETPEPGAPARVLVIDDEVEIGEIVADFLKLHGHTVDVAGSGEEALRMIRATDYGAILSDIRMPGMDGPALYRALQEASASAAGRLAFITGDTLSTHVSEFLNECGRPHIEKPLRPKEVAALVASLTKS